MSSDGHWTENEARFLPLFARALGARDSGQLEKARAMLEFVLRKLGENDARLACKCELQVSYACKLLGDALGRLEHATRAVELAPRDELASMTRFHALLGCGERVLAMAECVRFLTHSDSPAYRELLSQGFGLDLPVDELELAVEARRLLRLHAKDTNGESE